MSTRQVGDWAHPEPPQPCSPPSRTPRGHVAYLGKQGHGQKAKVLAVITKLLCNQVAKFGAHVLYLRTMGEG